MKEVKITNFILCNNQENSKFRKSFKISYKFMHDVTHFKFLMIDEKHALNLSKDSFF